MQNVGDVHDTPARVERVAPAATGCVLSVHEVPFQRSMTVLVGSDMTPTAKQLVLLHDLAAERPDVVAEGAELLRAWRDDLLPGGARGGDPHDHVMAEGGPFHVRGALPDYLVRLRATGRGAVADRLAARWS